jgi:hypothetical protein
MTKCERTNSSSSQLTPRRFLDTSSKTPELKSSREITTNLSPRTLNLRKLYHIKNLNYQTSEQLYNNRKPDQKWMQFKRDDGKIQMFIPITPDGEVPLKKSNKQSPLIHKNPKRLRIVDSDSDNTVSIDFEPKHIRKSTIKANELLNSNNEYSESLVNSCVSPVIMPIYNNYVSRYWGFNV